MIAWDACYPFHTKRGLLQLSPYPSVLKRVWAILRELLTRMRQCRAVREEPVRYRSSSSKYDQLSKSGGWMPSCVKMAMIWARCSVAWLIA
jgi:hypothetical protein